MSRFAVQCMATTYVMTMVIVEAETFEGACKEGIHTANHEGDWETVDCYGPTFVSGAVEHPSDDPAEDIRRASLNIPTRYSEDGLGRNAP